MANVESRYLFVVGYRPDDSMFQELLVEAENKHDLLYLTVSDDSKTLKELHAYRWLEKYCPNAKFTFKTTDYLFLNTFLLHEIISELKPDWATGKVFLGIVFENTSPQRDKRMPFYVSYEQYPKDSYPSYCSGLGYLMNLETRNHLVSESLKDESPFPIPDVYITGLLVERLGFTCSSILFDYQTGGMDMCINALKMKKNIPLRPPVLICSTSMQPQHTLIEYYRIWAVLKSIYGDAMRLNQSRSGRN